MTVSIATDEQIDAAIERAIPKIAAAVVAALEAKHSARFIGQAELGKLLGRSPKAMSAYLAREGGTELNSIAVTLDGSKRWRLSDVEALLSRRAPKLRSVATK